MKIVAGIFGVLLCLGVVLFFTHKTKHDDSTAIKRYLQTRGAAPVPKSWKEKIGDGI